MGSRRAAEADRWGRATEFRPSSSRPSPRTASSITPNNTSSIIRFITAHYDLPVLPDGQPPMGDLTAALDLTH